MISGLTIDMCIIRGNTKHLYIIYTMVDQRLLLDHDVV